MRRTIATTNATIKCRNNDCYNFEIPLDGTQAVRDGDDLTLSFPNGDRLVLEGYYRKSVSILLDGDEVPADGFFASRESAQPASSHGSAVKFEESPTQTEPEEAIVLDGISHLETIDLGSPISDDAAQAVFDDPNGVILSRPEARFFEQAVASASLSGQEQSASDVAGSCYISLEEASKLGEIPAPDPSEYASADLLKELYGTPVSVALSDAAAAQDKAGKESMSIQNQEVAMAVGESAEDPEPAAEKNEIRAHASVQPVPRTSASSESAASSVSGDIPDPEIEKPVQASADAKTPVVDSDNADSGPAASLPDPDQKLAAELKPEAQATAPAGGKSDPVSETETPIVAKQDENAETGEQPVAVPQEQIREISASSASQIESAASGNTESFSDKTPFAESQDKTSETVPPVTAVDKTDPVTESEEPVVDSSDKYSETDESGVGSRDGTSGIGNSDEETDPAINAQNDEPDDESGAPAAGKDDFEPETPVVDEKQVDREEPPVAEVENEISGTGHDKEDSGFSDGSVVGDETEEPLAPVSGKDDSGDASSESGQAPTDGNGGNPDSGVSQQDETGGTDPAPSHTFKSSIILPEDVVSIIRVVKQGKYGDIVQREDGEWVYQLNSAINSGDEQGANTVPEADYVYVMILDKWGNKLRTKVTVAIIDDVPELDVKGEENLESGAVYAGKISYSYGADYIDYDDHDPKHLDVTSGVETVSVNDFVNPIVIKGQYGVLTIQPNGKYSYKANPLLHGQEGGTDTFTFSITDADGDTVTKNLDGSAAGLTFIVEKPADPEAPVISEVYEKALPDGTEPGDPSSSVTIPNGYELIVKEGGDHPGHLEKNPDGSWKYVLDKPIDSGDEQGENTVDPGDAQTVILRDKNGNEWEFDVSVAIVDDAPTADDDYASIQKGEEAVVSSGSVLDNDKFGADGRAETDGFVWNVSDLETDENGRYVLEHGSIQLNADGTYTYYLDNTDHDVITLTEGKSLFEEITYQIKDADGDLADATLTIEIKGKNNGITVTPKDPDKDPDPTPDPDDPRDKDPDPEPDPTDPDQPDPEIPVEPGDPDIPVDPADPSTTAAVEQIKERELRAGEPVKRHGDLEISAPDGITSIKIGDVDIPLDGEMVTVNTEIGTLQIRFDRESEIFGRLKYEYTLNKVADHGKETGAFDNTDILNEVFKLLVTDSDGTEAKSQIIVRVIDDVPTAAPDSGEISEGDEEPVIGNVMYKSEAGADGLDRVEWLEGEMSYGELTVNADGSWSYVLNNDNEAVLGLKEGEELTETRNFRVYDKDGDWSEETLTITIKGISGDPTITPDEPDPDVPSADPNDPDAHGALITVYEKNLSDGTDPDADKLTVTGTMQIKAPDGLQSVKIGETVISRDSDNPTELKIGENTLSLWLETSGPRLGTLHYSFTLTDELSHRDGVELLDELLSQYQLVVTDLEGKTASVNLHVKVIDDNPDMTLAGDVELESGHEVDVDPFSFIVGADNGDGKKLVVTFKDGKGEAVLDSEGNVLTVEIDDPNSAWEIKGQFGTLSRDAEGNYTYKADPFDEDALGETLDGDEFTLPDQVKDTFTFTLLDADGDATESEDWTATINKPEYGGDTEIPEALKRPLITWEADLADGAAVYEITVPDGYEIIEVYGDPVHGEIFEEDGKWFYRLTEEIDSGGIQGSNWVKNADSFTIWVERASDGADFEVKVPVTIVDDVPMFGEDGEIYEKSDLPIGDYTLRFVGDYISVEAELSGQHEDGKWSFSIYGLNGEKTEITYDENDIPTKDDIPVYYPCLYVILENAYGDVVFHGEYWNLSHNREEIWEDVSNILNGVSPDDVAKPYFELSFGEDGPANIPFTIEDGIEADSAENNIYTFEIKDHASLPNGQIVIQKAGDNWQYSFIPDNTNFNYDFDIKLNASDADGDITSKTLHFVKSVAPELSEPDSISVDEGVQPYHENTHENSGERAFTVNLHGDDGTIQLGEIAIAIENGVATPDKSAFTTENGIVIELDEIACDADGIWTINYSYSHNGEAQQHGESGWEGNALSNEIAVTVTSANGKRVSESISGFVHDDIPVFGEVVADEEPVKVFRYEMTWGDHAETMWYNYGSLNGIIEANVELDSSVPFNAGDESCESLPDGRFRIHFDRTCAHPAGNLFLDPIGDSKYFYAFLPEDGEQFESKLQLSALTPDGQEFEFSISCSPMAGHAIIHNESGEEIFSPYIYPVLNGEYVIDENVPEFFLGKSKPFPVSTIKDTYQEFLDADDPYSSFRVLEKGLIPQTNSSILTGSFTVSFGADGMNADIPFKVEAAEPATSEDNRWTYDLAATDSHPAGQFIISQTEFGFTYEFVPANENLNFDASQIRIAVIDGDGDVADQTVTVSRHLPPLIADISGEEFTTGADASEFAVDEGNHPEHDGEESHGAGKNSFTVNLHGQDGQIDVSGLVVTIENGEASFDAQRAVGKNGAELSIVSVELNESGRWEIGYSYRYADESGQKHEVGSDELAGTIGVTVTGSDGQKAVGTITAIIHDDMPEIESSSHEVAAGQTITGEIPHDFGADADGRLVMLADGEEREIGEDGLELAGAYGMLKISSAGYWSYLAQPGSEGTDSFDLRVIDGDGDTADATLKINVDSAPVFGEVENSISYPVGIIPLYRYNYWSEGVSLNPRPTEGPNPGGHSGEFSERGLIKFRDYSGFSLVYDGTEILVTDETNVFELGPISFHRFEGNIWDYFIDISKIDGNFDNWVSGEYRSFSMELRYPDSGAFTFEIEGQLCERYECTNYSIRSEDESNEFACWAHYTDKALYTRDENDDMITLWEVEGSAGITKEEIHAQQALSIFSEALKEGIIPALERHDPLCGSCEFSFGSDGMADIPFTIEDGIEPVSSENGLFQFAINNHSELPDGMLTISQAENGRIEYLYAPENRNLNFTGSIRLNAIDGDGDMTSIQLTFSRTNPDAVASSESATISEADYLIADDSLDDLIGSASGYSSSSLTTPGADPGQLTEQEALVLEQAMRQVENQIS